MKKRAALLIAVVCLFASAFTAALEGAPARGQSRALVIGSAKFKPKLKAAKLPAVALELSGVARAMRVSDFDGRRINVSVKKNNTKRQIRQAIARKFKDAGPSDVSYLYISGHGTKVNGQFYMLPAIDAPISAAELKGWLDPIEGTVVLIVNTCLSGSVITGKGEASADFAGGFIGAFLRAGTSAKSTSIAGDKYLIICATADDELGWTYIDGFDRVNGKRRIRYADTFGTPFSAGIGWDYLDGAGVRSWLADEDFDGNITHRELYDYLRQTVGKQIDVRQTVTTYPAGGSEFVLFAQ